MPNPPPPDPTPNTYEPSTLKCCYKIVSKCYDCGVPYRSNGYSKEPNELVVTTKMQRCYVDPKMHQKPI